MARKHSIHCRGYRGVGKAFDEATCDCSTRIERCIEFIESACESDPYLSGMVQQQTTEETREFVEHVSGMLHAFVRQEVRLHSRRKR